MKLILDHIFTVGSKSLSIADLKEKEGQIGTFLNQFNERGQDFVKLPKLSPQLLAVRKIADSLKGKFKNIAILGIGGSALGITCLRDTMKGRYHHLKKETRLFVLDNLDGIQDFEEVVNLDETLFVVISKSGTTPETMAQYFYFREKVSREHFVFITDPDKGELRQIGLDESIPMLDIPTNVGGRFSVLSAVGLFPAAMMGLDLDALLKGAEEMSDSFKSLEFELNYPFQLATVQYLLEWQHGIHMTVMMPYATRLSSFADWYGQLLAESIGKEGKGLTPIRALGATDQHSQLQLYNEGPTDKLIMLLEVLNQKEPRLPKVEVEALNYLSERSFDEILRAELQATEQALTEYQKPNLRIQIDQVDEYNLGSLFMLFECSIAFLGEYYRINAFDQPGVELGKQLTKKILSSPR